MVSLKGRRAPAEEETPTNMPNHPGWRGLLELTSSRGGIWACGEQCGKMAPHTAGPAPYK